MKRTLLYVPINENPTFNQSDSNSKLVLWREFQALKSIDKRYKEVRLGFPSLAKLEEVSDKFVETVCLF